LPARKKRNRISAGSSSGTNISGGLWPITRSITSPSGIFFGLILLILMYVQFFGYKGIVLYSRPWKLLMAGNSYNTGPGIPADELPKVFEQFYRAEKSRATQYGGVGLGLSIVQEIVRLHRGTVSIDSEPGVWTQVDISFKT
jgi:hypothetical protein